MRYFLVILTLLSFACEKTIPYDEETFEERIVVNALLIAGDSIKVELTSSMSILGEPFDEGFEDLNNCNVKLFKNGIMVEELNQGDDGYYQFDQIAQPFQTYRLEITHSDLPAARCTTTLPGPVAISSATGIVNSNEFNTRISLTWNDNEAVDSYQVLLYESNQPGQPSFSNLNGWSTTSPYFPSDPLSDNGENYFYSDAIFLDDLFQNGTGELNMTTFNGGNENNSNTVALFGCSEEYYLYKSTLKAYYESDGGLFAQPVQIYSNVEDGFGIFASATKSLMEVVY